MSEAEKTGYTKVTSTVSEKDIMCLLLWMGALIYERGSHLSGYVRQLGGWGQFVSAKMAKQGDHLVIKSTNVFWDRWSTEKNLMNVNRFKEGLHKLDEIKAEKIDTRAVVWRIVRSLIWGVLSTSIGIGCVAVLLIHQPDGTTEHPSNLKILSSLFRVLAIAPLLLRYGYVRLKAGFTTMAVLKMLRQS